MLELGQRHEADAPALDDAELWKDRGEEEGAGDAECFGGLLRPQREAGHASSRVGSHAPPQPGDEVGRSR